MLIEPLVDVPARSFVFIDSNVLIYGLTGVSYLPVSESILRSAQAERQTAGLLTNDSLIISCMREYGLSFLATNDSDFERVVDITLFKPGDLPG
jgi:predicted nucleic acid-binding protein